jgi:circadian clock protein KaiC
MTEKNTRKRYNTNNGIKKIATGIKGFDEIFQGGIPKNRAMLLIGGSGSGKTVLLNEFIYRGITEFGEKGVFVTMEEQPQKISENVKGFGWDYNTLVKRKQLKFVDCSPVGETLEEIGQDYDCTVILERIKYAVKKVKAKRVVIDCLDSLFLRLTNAGAVRNVLCKISTELSALGVTVMMTVEKTGQAGLRTRFGVEDFVADSFIEMDIITGEHQIIRRMLIRKARGIGYRASKVQFEITDTGLSVFPKMGVYDSVQKTNFGKRKKSGVEGMDTLLSGGIPQGHVVLVSGNTGTGKTTLSLQFIKEGLERSENGLVVNLEEPLEQVKKTIRSHGWPLAKYQKSHKLHFLSNSLIDMNLDKLLCEIVRMAEKHDIQRMTIDSISSILSASANVEQVRQFLLQLSRFVKARGITLILNYLMTENFGAGSGQLLYGLRTSEMRLSSVCDGIILLLYTEKDQGVRILMNILKLRGAAHDRRIHEVGLTRRGVRVLSPFVA